MSRVVERVEVKDDAADVAEAVKADRNSAEGMASREVSSSDMPPPPPEDGEGAPNAWSDEAAESVFRAETRPRGDAVVAPPAAVDLGEEKDIKALPPLAELVNRLSPEIRETLDELFRAKFTAVKRLPKQAFKSSGG